MLCVSREGVTECALKLQRAGLISVARGHVSVLDRQGLERRSCECYAMVKHEYNRLLPTRLAACAVLEPGGGPNSIRCVGGAFVTLRAFARRPARTDSERLRPVSSLKALPDTRVGPPARRSTDVFRARTLGALGLAGNGTSHDGAEHGAAARHSDVGGYLRAHCTRPRPQRRLNRLWKRSASPARRSTSVCTGRCRSIGLRPSPVRLVRLTNEALATDAYALWGLEGKPFSLKPPKPWSPPIYTGASCRRMFTKRQYKRPERG